MNACVEMHECMCRQTAFTLDIYNIYKDISEEKYSQKFYLTLFGFLVIDKDDTTTTIDTNKNNMNKIFLFGLLINAFAQATADSMCALKRDASYAGFTHCSNDIHAYETFFNDTFSECASKSDLQQ